MVIKYQVYYALSKNGPWFLANEGTEVDHIENGLMEYTITGLGSNVVYWIAVVGGKEVNGKFLPLLTQSIGPKKVGTQAVGEVISAQFKVKTFAPTVNEESILTNQFEVI